MKQELHFTAMTMNLRFGLADSDENAWEIRKNLFPDLFSRYKPDLLGVQESNHFQTDDLDKILTDHRYVGKIKPEHETWQNNPIFYRNSFHCLDVTHFFLSGTPQVQSGFQGSEWPRQCIIGLFEHKEKKLVFANTHFDFNESVQIKSAELVIKHLAAFPDSLPSVITGDFNSPPQSGAREVFRRNGFAGVFENTDMTTFHRFKGEETGVHVDWILYRGGLEVEDGLVIKDSFNGRYPSDHYPVLVKFRMD